MKIYFYFIVKNPAIYLVINAKNYFHNSQK